LPDPIVAGQTYKVELIDSGGGNKDPNYFNIKKGNTLVNTTGAGSGTISRKDKKVNIVKNFKNSWKVMYSDDLPDDSGFAVVPNQSRTVVLLPPPGSSETYLAMSIV
jgi:hypothetical protein